MTQFQPTEREERAGFCTVAKQKSTLSTFIVKDIVAVCGDTLQLSQGNSSDLVLESLLERDDEGRWPHSAQFRRVPTAAESITDEQGSSHVLTKHGLQQQSITASYRKGKLLLKCKASRHTAKPRKQNDRFRSQTFRKRSV